MKTQSHHFLLDFYQVEDFKRLLDNVQEVEHIVIKKAIRKGKATYINHHTVKFFPQGLSAIFLLAESHISIHTWPEEQYAAFDVFTCGTKEQGEAIVKTLVKEYRPKTHTIQYIERGTPPAVENTTPNKI